VAADADARRIAAVKAAAAEAEARRVVAEKAAAERRAAVQRQAASDRERRVAVDAEARRVAAVKAAAAEELSSAESPEGRDPHFMSLEMNNLCPPPLSYLMSPPLFGIPRRRGAGAQKRCRVHNGKFILVSFKNTSQTNVMLARPVANIYLRDAKGWRDIKVRMEWGYGSQGGAASKTARGDGHGPDRFRF
jgi:hypothetical protein